MQLQCTQNAFSLEKLATAVVFCVVVHMKIVRSKRERDEAHNVDVKHRERNKCAFFL